MNQKQNQRILITAGASGIGRALAEAFLAHGDQVHICDISLENLTQCQTSLKGIRVTQADVSSPEQVDQLFEEVKAGMGGLDVLVNNAGIAGPTAPIEDITAREWEQTFAVNINGPFYCTRRAVPLLKASGGGSIVNISSTAGLMGYPLRSPYAASKWAVIGLTQTLAMELGEFNIRVNAICPGSVEGPRMDRVIAAEAKAQGVSEESIRTGYLLQASLRTFIQPSDIANMALFLSSEAGNKISGQALSVDGNVETARA